MVKVCSPCKSGFGPTKYDTAIDAKKVIKRKTRRAVTPERKICHKAGEGRCNSMDLVLDGDAHVVRCLRLWNFGVLFMTLRLP